MIIYKKILDIYIKLIVSDKLDNKNLIDIDTKSNILLAINFKI